MPLAAPPQALEPEPQAALALQRPSQSRPAPSIQMPEPNTAQALGFNCATPYGYCPIAPQPLGSVCYCGSTPGRVVP